MKRVVVLGRVVEIMVIFYELFKGVVKPIFDEQSCLTHEWSFKILGEISRRSIRLLGFTYQVSKYLQSNFGSIANVIRIAEVFRASNYNLYYSDDSDTSPDFPSVYIVLIQQTAQLA